MSDDSGNSKVTPRSRRRVPAVNYVALNGGSDDDETVQPASSLKRHASGEDELSSPKKSSVNVSFGAPVSREVVNESASKAQRGSQVKISRVIFSEPNDSTDASRRQKILIRLTETRPPPSPPKPTPLPSIPAGDAPDNADWKYVVCLTDGIVKPCATSASPVRHPTHRSVKPDAPPAKPSRSVLVRLPNGGYGRILDRSVVPVAIAPPSPEPENPFKAEDEEFMNEVNKFLDSSMQCGKFSAELRGAVGTNEDSFPCRNAAPSSSGRNLSPPLQTESDPCAPDEVEDAAGMVTCPMCGAYIGKRSFKTHQKTCRGIKVRWRQLNSRSAPQRRQTCGRCLAVVTSERDLAEHMAVQHRYFWRLDFDCEADFKQWFLEEGLDETTIAGPSKTHAGVHEKVFYCAVSGGQRMKVKCPCRVVVKKSPAGVVVRYFPSHNHADRVVRQQMSNECREMIMSLLRRKMKNADILKAIHASYPENSVNRSISALAISRLRCRYFRPARSSGKPETRGRKPKAARAKDAAELQE